MSVSPLSGRIQGSHPLFDNTIKPLSVSPVSALSISSPAPTTTQTLNKTKQKSGKSAARHIIDGFRSLNKKTKPATSLHNSNTKEAEIDLAFSPLTSLQFQSEFHTVEAYQVPQNVIDANHYFENDTNISTDINASYYQNPAVTFIPKEKLIFGEKLGGGEFGCVFRGKYIYKNNHIDVAIKTLYPEHSDADQKAFLQEAELMMNLHHPCIVRLIGICDVSTFLLKI